MKTEIHPEYVECRVVCSCGNDFTTRATVPELRVELCSECHPFYTGKQKLVDTGGRVERFERRYKDSKAGGAAKKKDEGEETSTKPAPARKRKAPVAAKQARPKFEPRKGRDDEDGRSKGEGKGKGKGKGGDAPEASAEEAPAEASEG